MDESFELGTGKDQDANSEHQMTAILQKYHDCHNVSPLRVASSDQIRPNEELNL
jgi:hypothetical protein